MALLKTADDLKLLKDGAPIHGLPKFNFDNISVRPSHIDDVVKSIYEELENLDTPSTLISLTDTAASSVNNGLLRWNAGGTSVDYIVASAIDLSEFNNDLNITTLYSADDALAGPRTVTLTATNSLTFTGGQTSMVGSGTSSGTYGLQIHNSTGVSNSLIVRDDGVVGINTLPTTLNYFSVRSLSGSGSATIYDGRNSGGNQVFVVNNNGAFTSGNITGTSTLLSFGRSYFGVGSGSAGLEFLKFGGNIATGSDKLLKYRRESITDAMIMEFYNGSGSIAVKIGAGTESSYFNGGGNLGVGINAPTSRVHILGEGVTSGTKSFSASNSSVEKFFVRDDGMVSATDYYALDGTRYFHNNGVVNNTFCGSLCGESATGLGSAGVGRAALMNLTTGTATAVGVSALANITVGIENAAFGSSALGVLNSTVGNNFNTAMGTKSLQALLTGNFNTALGASSGASITGGIGNTFLGGSTTSDGLGVYNNSIALGRNSSITASNQMVVGDNGSGATINQVIWGSGEVVTAIGALPDFTMQITSIEGGAGNTDEAPDYNWVNKSSAGTGIEDGGGLIYQTAPGGSTGDAQNPFVTALTIQGDGLVAIGDHTATSKLHVEQANTTGALPVLTLDQKDVDQSNIEFLGTIGTGNSIEAIDAKTLTTTHFLKVTLQGGLIRYIPVGTIA